jgi:hypothetical protein
MTKEKIEENIDNLYIERDKHISSGIREMKKLGNLGVYYARQKDESLTLYVLDSMETEKEYASSHNIPQFVKVIDEQIDRIEAIKDTW